MTNICDFDLLINDGFVSRFYKLPHNSDYLSNMLSLKSHLGKQYTFCYFKKIIANLCLDVPS